MKILYICNEYPPAPHGGIGTYTRFLAEALVTRGHEVAIVGYDLRIHEPFREVCNGVLVHRFPAVNGGKRCFGRIISFFKERRELSMLVDQVGTLFSPDIVESYDWSGPLMRKPIFGHFVVRMHGAHAVYNRLMGISKKSSKLIFYQEKRNLGFADSLVSVSQHIAKESLATFHLDASDIPVIYNGVDTQRFVSLNEKQRDPKKLLFVGRVHPHKGLDLLFRALEIVFLNNTTARLDVVGSIDSCYAEKLKGSLTSSLRSRINFNGRVPNEQLPSIYANAFLCFQPSRVEALGITCLESMACGTPVIMSSLVAAKEIIDDGVDGFITDPRDTEGFAKCILTALANQEAIESMRPKCRAKIVKCFSLEKIVEENERLYEGCLK